MIYHDIIDDKMYKSWICLVRTNWRVGVGGNLNSYTLDILQQAEVFNSYLFRCHYEDTSCWFSSNFSAKMKYSNRIQIVLKHISDVDNLSPRHKLSWRGNVQRTSLTMWNTDDSNPLFSTQPHKYTFKICTKENRNTNKVNCKERGGT